MDNTPTIRLNLSQAFHNKELLPGYTRAAFADSFVPSEVTVQQFIEHVVSGGAWTLGYFNGNHRNRKNFISSQLLALDFDEGARVSVERALSHPFIRQYACLVYPTPSSTPDNPRTRAVFRLSEPIDDVQRWEALQRGLLRHFADWRPDKACKDAARMFYGSDRKGSVIL